MKVVGLNSKATYNKITISPGCIKIRSKIQFCLNLINSLGATFWCELMNAFRRCGVLINYISVGWHIPPTSYKSLFGDFEKRT